MIVPRDIEGQRLLWRWLSSIFGNSSCPEPEPPEPCPSCSPCPEPEPPAPCIQDYLSDRWNDVLVFRRAFDDIIHTGRDWGALGLRPDCWYMWIEPNVVCMQMVRFIEYNTVDGASEITGVDGFVLILSEGVSYFCGVDDDDLPVLKPGQPAVCSMSYIATDRYITLHYNLKSLSDEPSFPEHDHTVEFPTHRVHEVYLSFWNWGYAGYRPDMDRDFTLWMMKKNPVPHMLERPKVMNL